MEVNSKFNQTYKVPNDLSFHSDSIFHGFLINAGYVAKHGEVACVERRSMTKLISMVQALRVVPGYSWHAYHVRFTVVPARAQIGDEAEAEARTGHLLLQKVKRAIKDRFPRVKIFYRWHLNGALVLDGITMQRFSLVAMLSEVVNHYDHHFINV